MNKKKILKATMLAVCIIMMLISGGMIMMAVSFHSGCERGFVPTGPNAVWARHQWVGEAHARKEYTAFFNKLKKNRITDVYFHVGPWVDQDGGIQESKYAYADELVLNAREMYPGLRIHAWIGQMTVQGSGSLDLSDPGIRNNIVETARVFIALGFDGIHYDFEPVRSGDASFIDLLVKTRAITSKKGRFLSIASGQVEPFPYSSRVFEAITPNASFWTRDYFIDVSRHVDQIAVMLYDTALPADWMYGTYVQKQVQALVPIMREETTLLFGVPTYDENRAGHRPWAENIQASITGIHHGLDEVGITQSERIGIALFADWTTDDEEWKYYREHWLAKDRNRN